MSGPIPLALAVHRTVRNKSLFFINYSISGIFL
jgi:hypothetical protein